MIERCPNMDVGCPFYDRDPRGPLKEEQFHGCYSDSHHVLYPANRYQTPLEKAYRDLPENKEQVCAWTHQLIHEQLPPPKKPSLRRMIAALTIKIEMENDETEDFAV